MKMLESMSRVVCSYLDEYKARCKVCCFLTCFTITFTGGQFFNIALAADVSITDKPELQIIQLTRSTPASVLKNLKDTDKVRLANGRELKMSTIRQFSTVAKRLKATKGRHYTPPKALTMKPSKAKLQVQQVSDLAQILQQPDETPVKMPSGNIYTVAQIKLVQPLLEARLGKKIDSFPSKHKGKTVLLQKSADRAYWKSILSKPDNTVLTTSEGQEFTVGELKQFIKEGNVSLFTSGRKGGEK